MEKKIILIKFLKKSDLSKGLEELKIPTKPLTKLFDRR
jgi:hypothetical protein